MSLTPEIDKRGPYGPEDPLHPDVLAAYNYVNSVASTADVGVMNCGMWYGWALREAFLAGISYANQEKVKS